MDQPGSDAELLRSLNSWLLELVKDKQEARAARLESAKAKVHPFRSWLLRPEVLTIAVTAVAAAVGAGWTLYNYFDTERVKLAQARSAAIAQFAVDLSDPIKRNSAAYAVATLAKADALPLLIPHLKESVQRENDREFRTALGFAIGSVGEAGLQAAIQLNREAGVEVWSPFNREFSTDVNQWRHAPLPGSDLMIEATQATIIGVLRNDRSVARSTDNRLDGVTIVRPKFLMERDWASLNLRNTIIEKGDFCDATLTKADFRGVKFIDAVMFGRSDLRGAKFDGAMVTRVNGDTVRGNFGGAHMEGASLRSTILELSIFDFAYLADADFSASRLKGSYFIGSDLPRAVLSDADLRGANFQGANLNDAKFNNSTLEGAIFSAVTFVAGADFADAKGLPNEDIRLLCAGGARNVPGGCDEIARWAAAGSVDTHLS